MTYEILNQAIDSNKPFTIHMADGKNYEVPHRDFIAFSPKRTTAVVVLEQTHYLPLLTMTGVTVDSTELTQ